MIRTTLIPDKRNVSISFSFPDNYIGEEVEVIAFTKKEGLIKIESTKKNISFTVLHVDPQNYKFDRNEANER